MTNNNAVYSRIVRRLVAMLSASLLLGLASASAQTPSITEYPIPTANYSPGSIANGPDGNLWFTFNFSGGCDFDPCPIPVDAIGKITPAGVVTLYPIPTPNSGPAGVVTGPDGNLWFTEFNTGNIGKITSSGVITEFPLPSAQSAPKDIALGSDGNLWFTEVNAIKIGKITPTGVITEFPGVTGSPQSITGGPDGNLWVTEYAAACGTDTCVPVSAAIARITLAGVVTEFPVVTANSVLNGIARGPDGNLWFCEDLAGLGPDNFGHYGAIIGKITPQGVVTEYAIPTASSAPSEITSGPDGNLWFTENNANQIGRVTPSGVITEYATPTANSGPDGITTGPDGNLWFTEYAANQIGKLVTGAGITISPGFTGNWFDTSQSGHGFSIEVLPGNQMLAQWYVFGPNGGQSWIVATGPITGDTAVLQGFQPVGSGGRFPPNFNTSQLTNQPWGAITFTFTDCDNGTVSWKPTAEGYTSGSIPISRLTMPAGLTCP